MPTTNSKSWWLCELPRNTYYWNEKFEAMVVSGAGAATGDGKSSNSGIYSDVRSKSTYLQSIKAVLFLVVFTFMVISSDNIARAQSPSMGTWQILVPNAGIASMHTAITRYGQAILLDRTDGGPSNITTTSPTSSCAGGGCSAHSAMVVLEASDVLPLVVVTNPWCSSGQFVDNGTLVQTGGDGNGSSKIRYFDPCPPGGVCDWVEDESQALQAPRWYATDQLLPDGRMIVIGGINQPNLEFVPNLGEGLVLFPFLSVNEDSQGDNLYPYVHLLPDGNLFIFCNKASILYNYMNNIVVKTFPDILGEPRSYPSAGSSVLLPLSSPDGNIFDEVEVMVCGGAQFGAFANKDDMLPASNTCGRLQVTDLVPEWVMETMPSRRCMGDMILLPTKSVLIINGAQAGAQGFNNAFYPNLTPVLYQPDAPLGLRFSELSPTMIPRMYHSTANLLPDGRVLLAGSNANNVYSFVTGPPTSGQFPTELRVEAFSPPYLDPTLSILKPSFIFVPTSLIYNQPFSIEVILPSPLVGNIGLCLMSAPFATHSFSQGQRLLELSTTNTLVVGNNRYQIASISPARASLAPPSYYMLFATNQGVPSVGAWVHIGS